MKRIGFLYTLLLLLTAGFAAAQPTLSGVRLDNGTAIALKQQPLPGIVVSYAVDTAKQQLIAQLQYPKPGEGFYRQSSLVNLNLATWAIKWNIPVGDIAVMMQDSTIIALAPNVATRINAATGQPEWSVLNGFVYVDSKKRIGFGYSTQNPNLLVGVNLTNGKQLWSRMLVPEVGWKRVFALNDSTVLLNTTGLHSINIFTGKGWDYDGSSVDSTQQTRVAHNLYYMGINTAYWDNPNVLAYYNPDWSIWDIQSNVVAKDARLYYADKKQLSCVDYAGNKIWNEAIPVQYRSKSSIFIVGNTLYMVAKGFAYQGINPSTTIPYGDFFLSAFDLATGQQIYFSTPPKASPQVMDFRLAGESIYVLFKNQVSQYALTNGNELTAQSFKRSRTGDFLQFLSNAAYISTPSGEFTAPTSTNLYINSAHGSYMLSPTFDGSVGFLYAPTSLSVVELNSSLDFVGNLQDSSFYWRSKTYAGLSFFTNGSSTIIQNSEGKFTARIPVGENIFFIGQNLYAVMGGVIVSVSIELLK